MVAAFSDGPLTRSGRLPHDDLDTAGLYSEDTNERCS